MNETLIADLETMKELWDISLSSTKQVAIGLGSNNLVPLHDNKEYKLVTSRQCTEGLGFSMALFLGIIIPAFRRGPVCGDSLERSYLFYDRPSRLSSNAPACRGQSRLSGFCCAHRLCVWSPCQHISRMRTFDNNSCAISITSPRSLFRPRTQHGRWGHREKSRRASTRWDCRGKSCLAGLSPLSGTPSERRAYERILQWNNLGT